MAQTETEEIKQAPTPANHLETSRASRFAASRRRYAKPLILGAVLTLVLAAVLLWIHYSRFESTDDAQIDGHVSPISARVSGYIIKINVEDNRYVEAGTVLAEIDPRDYLVAVQLAQADLAEAQTSAQAAGVNVPIVSVSTGSQLTAAEADVESARAGVAAAAQQADAARAQLAAAEANNARAQSDLVRYRQLVEKQEISQQQYDQAVAAARAGAASVQAAQAAAMAAQQQVTQARDHLAQTQAGLRSAHTAPQQVEASRSRAASALATAQRKQAALDQANLNLQYTKIVAPISGVVSGRTAEVGQNLQPGQELMKLISLDDVWVTANFKETQLQRMQPGQPVTISVDAYGRKYKGHLDSIAGASGARFSLLPPENATGNYVKVVQRVPVKISLEPGSNRDRMLRPGMSVVPTVRVR